MKQVQLEVNVRKVLKKNEMNRLREQKIIPAVMYGQGKETINLQVMQKAMHKVLHTSAGTNVLINLTIADSKEASAEAVMIKAMQQHPVTSELLHIDFMRVDMSKALETSVPVVFEGIAPGTKLGGVLQQLHRELSVRALPTLIPENIVVDISSLGIAQSINVGEIQVAEGVEILTDKKEPVVHILAPRVDESKTAVAAAPAAETKQPEVIGEKEREERRADKEKK